MFCGRHLLVAKLRRANIDAAADAVEEVARVVARIRARWPRTRILLRADSGFARDDLMAWCEANGVDFVFGLQKNERLITMIEGELAQAEARSRRTGEPERRFKSFMWTTRTSCAGLCDARSACAAGASSTDRSVPGPQGPCAGTVLGQARQPRR